MTTGSDAGSQQVEQSQSNDSVDYGYWKDHTRIALTPVAPPSILGLFGFAASTFMVSAHIAGWYGTEGVTSLILFPFAMTFGGLAQFLAGMWAYRARDAVATAAHGTWGAFWLAYGIYHIFIAVGVLPSPSASTAAAVAYGFWFAMLAAVTWSTAFAAMADNLGIATLLFLLAAGSTLVAIGLMAQISWVEVVGALVLIASACVAWYVATAMMLKAATGRVVLPTGKPSKQANIPGTIPQQRIQYEAGDPGLKVGQ